jgi:hypothetical protein
MQGFGIDDSKDGCLKVIFQDDLLHRKLTALNYNNQFVKYIVNPCDQFCSLLDESICAFVGLRKD